MDSLTVSSSMLIPSASNVEITPAMLAVIWGIAHELDYQRVSANSENSVWLEIPSKRLRNPDGRDDNHHLKKVFKQLSKIELEGEYRGDDWGAVLIAQWELKQGGSLARLLIPPAAIYACRAPKTFAKIEMTAAYRLKGHARRLYAELADKKHMRQSYWEYGLDELRALFQAQDKYPRWVDFNRYVLTPALDEINDYGTVTVKAAPKKKGKAIDRVRFDWEWKNLDEARVTDEENERHGTARHKTSDASAPPLTDVATLPKQAQRIRQALDEAPWQSWFSKCKFQEGEDGDLILIAPTRFHAEHLKSTYGHLLENCHVLEAQKEAVDR